MIGPENAFSQELHATKYRDEGETFDDYCVRYARTTADDEKHFRGMLDALRHQRLLPAGRQQLAVGRPYEITAVNCFVGSTIDDSIDGIFAEVRRAAMTLRTGGGCGWDFSSLRPKGDPVRGLGVKAYSTGPVSFMGVWNATCDTIMSAGHRRGAMMAVLRVDHPDIMTFISAKQDQSTLKNFNISVAVTDEFMEALENDALYELKFGGRTYDKVRALDVWARIMERNWDWAEPGVLFIDRINQLNPLGYCETIAATNPCGEQPLPTNGACLLGSLNVAKYLTPTMRPRNGNVLERTYEIDMSRFEEDIVHAVRAFDNVIDRTNYPLEEQRLEQKHKRRMGLGVTGLANALEVCGYPYASEGYIEQQERILRRLRDVAYLTSVEIGKKKGVFPFFSAEGWLGSGFAQSLPEDIRGQIAKHGLRNGLLLSIAPTGTISMCADNVSSGIEPAFALVQERRVHMPQGETTVEFKDYAYEKYGIRGRTVNDVTAQEHVSVLCSAQKFIDSAVSKTCNVYGRVSGKGKGISFEEFKQLYMQAWHGGAKGCTTFNVNGKRFGILKSVEQDTETETDGAACAIDPKTGVRTCDG